MSNVTEHTKLERINAAPFYSPDDWRPVVGYESHYVVNPEGKVKGLYRNRVIKPFTVGKRRDRLAVKLCKYGKCKDQYLHRVIATAFHPNPDNKRTVNHIDGDKNNNHASNLEWMTHQENIIHAHKLGIGGKMVGEQHHMAKMTWDKVDSMRLEMTDGATDKQLSEKYGISRKSVWSIRKGKTWTKRPA